MNRRDFLKTLGITAAGMVLSKGFPVAVHATETSTSKTNSKPKVYFTRSINADSLKRMYTGIIHKPICWH